MKIHSLMVVDRMNSKKHLMNHYMVILEVYVPQDVVIIRKYAQKMYQKVLLQNLNVNSKNTEMNIIAL